MKIDNYEFRIAQAMAMQLSCSAEEFVELCIRTSAHVMMEGPRSTDAAVRMKEIIGLVREKKREAKELSKPRVSDEEKSTQEFMRSQKRSAKSLTHSPFAEFADALKKTKS
ncbi:MAG: hypothetical protein DRH30_05420 [Deltaproteobacteria bacterium]|nr:MAG: hypothetical protein DRH30_05420 [Deltaproteobacteria bacterium]